MVKVKLHRFRGRTLKFYAGVIFFSVASTFYILRPVLDVLEQRTQQAEQQSALSSIEAAKSK